MARLWKQVGTGLWVVMALMCVAMVTLVALTQGQSQGVKDDALLLPFAEFQPLYGQAKVLIVDVRDTESYATGHIPGAIHVLGRDVEAQRAALKVAAKGRLIVTYCSCPTEASSLKAARLLMEAGVKAKALVGGFPRWVESGGTIERG